jgi:hypothetical protein
MKMIKTLWTAASIIAIALPCGSAGAEQIPMTITPAPNGGMTADGHMSAHALSYECSKKSALCTGYIVGYEEALRIALKFADHPGAKLSKIGCFRNASVETVALSLISDLQIHFDRLEMPAWQELGMVLVGIPCTTN